MCGIRLCFKRSSPGGLCSVLSFPRSVGEFSLRVSSILIKAYFSRVRSFLTIKPNYGKVDPEGQDAIKETFLQVSSNLSSVIKANHKVLSISN